MDRYNRQITENGLGGAGDTKVAMKTASATLKPYEQVVRCDSTAGAMTITLPNVGEAKGLAFSITLVTDNGDVTIQDQDESFNWSDLTLADANDRYLLYSDGIEWWTLASVGI